MLTKSSGLTASGVIDSTEKIGDERQKPVSANSDRVEWQMDIAEFNRNGCLINSN